MLTTKLIALSLLGILCLILFMLRVQRRNGVRIPLGFAVVGFSSLCQTLSPEIHALISPFIDLSELEISQAFSTVVVLAIAYVCNSVIKRFVYRRRLTPEGDPKVPLIIQYLVSALVYLVALMLIVRLVYGQPIFAIAATSGALALVLGYSARTVLEEVFAGIALNFSSPFEKGDLIQLNEEWALVKDIDWRSITYVDMDNNSVVVPNTVVAASKIRNLDRPDGVTRRLFYFLVEYNTPPKVVIDMARAAMDECPHILDHEWNEVCLYDFDDTGIRYRAAFYIKSYWDWWFASNEYFNALWYRFKREGIRFGQQRHLNFKNDEDVDRYLPGSLMEDNNWRQLVARFDEVPMFEGLNKEDMVELAKSATLHVVGPPERIIRAGSARTSMYLIASGVADVFEVDDDGKETWMAEVGEGETVGLMSLLTGTPQRTTVRARTEAAVWEISSESLHARFETKPGAMENIAASVIKWQAEEEDVLNQIKLSRQQEKQLLAKRTDTLSARISRFFDRGKEDDESSDSYTEY
ncbi:MAG: mechanosensitive ion channel family protein [Pseudomonadota bacterium]